MSQLDLQNISVFADKKKIVESVSFSIQSSQLHVLMGPNGSGKSTLANAIFGHPAYTTKGKLLLDQKNILAQTTEKKARAGLLLSMQYLPAIEGVTLAMFLHKAYGALHGGNIPILDFYMQSEEKAKVLGINPSFLKRYIHAGMSGGEKKLSEILQLAILEPKFAVLDEIDSGVDVDSLKIVSTAIKTLQKSGTGFLLITHYDSLLHHLSPDFVHVMRDGKLIRSGGKELVRAITKHGFATIFEKKNA